MAEHSSSSAFLLLYSSLLIEVVRTLRRWTRYPAKSSENELVHFHCRLLVLSADSASINLTIAKVRGICRQLVSTALSLSTDFLDATGNPRFESSLVDFLFFTVTRGSAEQIESCLQSVAEEGPFANARRSRFVWTFPPLVLRPAIENAADEVVPGCEEAAELCMRGWRAKLEAYQVISFSFAADELRQVFAERSGELPEWRLRRVWQRVFPCMLDHVVLEQLAAVSLHGPGVSLAVDGRGSGVPGATLQEPMLTADLVRDFDFGCADAAYYGGEFVAIVELYCTQLSCNGRRAMEALGELFEKVEVYNCVQFASFLNSLLECKLVRGELVVPRAVFLRDFVHPLLDGYTELPELSGASKTAFERREAALQPSSENQNFGHFIQFILERCLVGLHALARKLKRGFTESEALLAVMQVELCVDSARNFRPVQQWREFQIDPASTDFLYCSLGVPNSVGRSRWFFAWVKFLQVCFSKTYPHQRLSKQNREALVTQLRTIDDFFFSSAWRPQAAEPPQAATHLEMHVLRAATELMAAEETIPIAEGRTSVRGFHRALDSRLGDLEAGFAVFSPADGQFAEILRSPETLLKSLGLFMPQVDALYASEFGLRQGFCDETMANLISRHQTHWRLLQEALGLTEEQFVDQLARPLVLAVLSDLRPWLGLDFGSRTRQIAGPVNFAGAVFLVQKAVNGLLDERLNSKLSQVWAFLAQLLVAKEGMPAAFASGLEYWSLALPDRRDLCPCCRDASQFKGRKRLNELGVDVLHTAEGIFEAEFKDIVSNATRYLRNLFAAQGVAGVADTGSASGGGRLPGPLFPETIALYLFAPLQLLYAITEVYAHDQARWAQFLLKTAERLLDEAIDGHGQREVVTKTCGFPRLAQELSLALMRPQSYRQVLHRMQALLGEAPPKTSTWASNSLLTPADLVDLVKTQVLKLADANLGIAWHYRLLTLWISSRETLRRLWREALAGESSSSEAARLWLQRMDNLLSTDLYTPVGEPVLAEPQLLHQHQHQHENSPLVAVTQVPQVPQAPPEPVAVGPVRKDGFTGLNADQVEAMVAAITATLQAVLTAVFSDAFLQRDFEELRDELLVKIKSDIQKAGPGVELTDHSGFVSMLTREISTIPSVPAAAIHGLATLVATLAIDKEKTRNKAVAAAKRALASFFPEPPPVSPAANQAPQAAVCPERIHGEQPPPPLQLPPPSVAATELAELAVAPADVTGLSGAPAQVAEFEARLVELLSEAFTNYQVAAASPERQGRLSLSKLEELRDSVRLEIQDLSLLRPASDSKAHKLWQAYLTCVVREVGAQTAGFLSSESVDSRDWDPAALIATILVSDSGKDLKTCTAKRVLSEDPRSVFFVASRLGRKTKSQRPAPADSVTLADQAAQDAIQQPSELFQAVVQLGAAVDGEASTEEVHSPAHSPAAAARWAYPEWGVSVGSSSSGGEQLFARLASLFHDRLARWSSAGPPLTLAAMEELAEATHVAFAEAEGVVEDAALLAIALEEKCMMIVPARSAAAPGAAAATPGAAAATASPCWVSCSGRFRSLLAELVVETLAGRPLETLKGKLQLEKAFRDPALDPRFDGSRPERYLVWRRLTLGRIGVNDLGSVKAVQVLLEAAPVLGYRGQCARPGKVFQAILADLDAKFDDEKAKAFVLEGLQQILNAKQQQQQQQQQQPQNEWDELLAKTLGEVKALFVELTPERKVIKEFIAALEGERREVAEMLFGFGDPTVGIFKARLKAFEASNAKFGNRTCRFCVGMR